MYVRDVVWGIGVEYVKGNYVIFVYCYVIMFIRILYIICKEVYLKINLNLKLVMIFFVLFRRLEDNDVG